LPHTLKPVLRSQKFFAGLADDQLALITGCASTTVFPSGAILFREGDPADTFYLIRDGKVALELAAPGRGALVIETLGVGEVVGFSWLIEPHCWQFDGRAVERVLAVKMDGACLRGKCEQDPRLGYELMRRFSAMAVTRLQAARLQVLDVYGHARSS
jgi:CRP/FNR family transcriptional regulator, cyclic AMP receptor protein